MKLYDRINIDITGKELVDIDLKQIIFSGVKTSDLYLVYSINSGSDQNYFIVDFIKTNNFADSNWNLIKIEDDILGTDLVYTKISDSSYLFIDISRYSTSSSPYTIHYNLFLTY